jgi:hypothetical protein
MDGLPVAAPVCIRHERAACSHKAQLGSSRSADNIYDGLEVKAQNKVFTWLSSVALRGRRRGPVRSAGVGASSIGTAIQPPNRLGLTKRNGANRARPRAQRITSR